MNNLVLTWTKLVHMPRWVSKQRSFLGFHTDHQCQFSFSWKLCHIYGFCVFSTNLLCFFVHQVAPFTHWMHFKSTVHKNYSWNYPE
jgi:hypothetical protein